MGPFSYASVANPTFSYRVGISSHCYSYPLLALGLSLLRNYNTFSISKIFIATALWRSLSSYVVLRESATATPLCCEFTDRLNIILLPPPSAMPSSLPKMKEGQSGSGSLEEMSDKCGSPAPLPGGAQKSTTCSGPAIVPATCHQCPYIAKVAKARQSQTQYHPSGVFFSASKTEASMARCLASVTVRHAYYPFLKKALKTITRDLL